MVSWFWVLVVVVFGLGVVLGLVGTVLWYARERGN